MAVDIVMPQMGESIFEGTITKWLKKPGDKVERDEPLFEISTDKVDAEIPSPSAVKRFGMRALKTNALLRMSSRAVWRSRNSWLYSTFSIPARWFRSA